MKNRHGARSGVFSGAPVEVNAGDAVAEAGEPLGIQAGPAPEVEDGALRRDPGIEPGHCPLNRREPTAGGIGPRIEVSGEQVGLDGGIGPDAMGCFIKQGGTIARNVHAYSMII
jgi:hypothetical protein